MKILTVLSLCGVALMGVGAAPVVSVTWVEPFDARPEAIATGGTLLVIAFLLRRGFKR